MKHKTNTNPASSKSPLKAPASARPVTPALIHALISKHKEHHEDLMLAAHCVNLAIQNYPDGHPLLEDNGIAVDGVTEWLFESTDELPKPTWLRIAQVLGEMFELLHKAHPHDYGFMLGVITFRNPDLYDNQLRFMEEERVVEILDLRDKPSLMATLELSDDCIGFYACQRNEITH